MTYAPYLKKASATFLWLIKFVAGVLALYTIFNTIKIVFPVFQLIGGADISSTVQSTFGGLGIEANFTKDVSDIVSIIGTSGIFFLSGFFALLVYALISPILSVIEAFGATNLRFRNRGAVLLKVTNIINAVACMIVILISVGSAAMMITKGKEALIAAGAGSDNVTTLIIFMVVFTACIVIAYLIMFCYYKDIARAMSTIDDNICNFETTMKKTHLSGLALFLGIINAIVCVLGLLMITQLKGDARAVIINVSVIGVTALKFFLVAACNKNVKKFNFGDEEEIAEEN